VRNHDIVKVMMAILLRRKAC